MMTNILETRFYDIMNHQTKLNKVDLNKAVGYINGVSAFLTLSFNLASGTANVLNANAQIFLESFLKGMTIKSSSVAKANKIYGMNMVDILSDIKNPVKKSYVNQVNELFNIRGLFNLSKGNFLKSDILKAGLDPSSLQVFQDSGEHWIQSIISMSVLDGIKVMDANNNFIDKEGNVVKSKKEAASLLDMSIKDKDSGKVHISDKVVYTTHSLLTKFNEGGKTKIDTLIRKKLYDSLGNYTEIDQPEIFRHAAGKLTMLYRKYLIPMGQARLKGVSSVFTRKEHLTEDQLNYSYALQEYEEGTYTTLTRFILTSLKDRKLELLMKNWDELSEYEIHNIKRAVVELILTNVMLPIAVAFVGGLAGDDDDEYLYFLAYQMRRLDTELSQYYSVSESYKILRSPIPSARLIETSASLFIGLFNPNTYTDVYTRGKWKGENKAKIKLEKQLPGLREHMREYKSLLNYQENLFGTGL